MLRRSGSAALVDWIPGLQYTIAVSLATYAAGDATAGLAQADAVQLAAGLAILRTRCSSPPGVGAWAIYDKNGTFLGERFADVPTLEALYKAEMMPIAIAGDNAIAKLPAGEGLPDTWGRDLALAIDQLLWRLGQAKTGANTGGVIVATPALALPAIAVIVAGVAVTVVSTVAAWRFLDGDTRTKLAAVEAAAESYSARLDIYQQSGQMPPASEIEKAAAGTVKELAAERGMNRWAWTAGGVGGGVALVVGGAALRRAMA